MLGPFIHVREPRRCVPSVGRTEDASGLVMSDWSNNVGVGALLATDFVAPPGTLTAAKVHAALREGDPESPVAVMDLRDLSWIDPAGLVALAALMEAQASIGRLPRLHAPHQLERSGFLHRMRLGEMVDEFDGRHDLSPVQSWNQQGYLLELQKFDGSNAAGALADIVSTQLSDTPVALAIHKGICEIGQNVPDHSGRTHGYIAVVTKPATGTVSFAVSDAGLGIVESLKVHGPRSHEDALTAVLEGGVSRLELAGRGRGIRRTREEVSAARGRLFLASGNAGVAAWKGPGGRPLRQARQYPRAIPGTLMEGTLPVST